VNHHRVRAALPALTALITLSLLSACGNTPETRPLENAIPAPAYVPVPTTEYRCAGGKRFFVRYREDGGQAWVVLPDRELTLPRIASQFSTRYSNGSAVLDAKGMDATLATGSASAYTECKRVSG